MTDRNLSGLLGHELVGSGPKPVVVLHDWLCDASTWEATRAYLDTESFSFAFTDLRGYGRSIELSGTFSLLEAAADVLALADALAWHRFSIVGHSMSALVALHLAQQNADRIERAVAVTPPPPMGPSVDEATLLGLEALARASAEERIGRLAPGFEPRLSRGFTRFKSSRWSATANPEAAAAYAAMFARDGLVDRSTKITLPILAITGEQDAPWMRQQAIAPILEPLCTKLSVTPLADCGHYPMQELPPRTVSLIERFLAG